MGTKTNVPDYIKDAFKVACIFLGCVIGAGFASGREIYSYFVIYKEKGFAGILLFAIFVFVTIYALTALIVRYKIKNQDQILKLCFGPYIGKILFMLITVFCFCEFSVMAAGFDALLTEQLDIKRGIGFIFFVIMMYFVLIFGEKAMISLNTILAPFMLWSIIFICIYVLLIQDVSVFKSVMGLTKTNAPYVSALLYWGYNALTGLGLLCALGGFITDKKRGVAITFSCVFLFVFAVLVVFLALGAYYNEIAGMELPVLWLAGLSGEFIKGVYALAIAAAMITTAAAAAYAVCACAPEGKMPLVAFFICGGSFLFYSYDFSYLVDNLYAFFGIAGIVFCAGVIFMEVKIRIFHRKREKSQMISLPLRKIEKRG